MRARRGRKSIRVLWAIALVAGSSGLWSKLDSRPGPSRFPAQNVVAVPNLEGVPNPKRYPGLRRREPLQPLKVVSSASLIPSVAGGQLVTVFGSGLAEINDVRITQMNEVYEHETFSVPVISVSDTQLNLLLPPVWAWQDEYFVLSAYRTDDPAYFELIGETRLYAEAVAPALFSADQSGSGAPVGQAIYGESAEGSTTQELTEELFARPGQGPMKLRLQATGAAAVWCPTRPEGQPPREATATLLTADGPKTVAAELELEGVAPGTQRFTVDITGILDADLLRAEVPVFVTVKNCEGHPVDSPELLLRFASPKLPESSATR